MTPDHKASPETDARFRRILRLNRDQRGRKESDERFEDKFCEVLKVAPPRSSLACECPKRRCDMALSPSFGELLHHCQRTPYPIHAAYHEACVQVLLG